MTTPSRLHPFNLRLPEDLVDPIKRAAEDAGQSMNTWMVRALRAALPTATYTLEEEEPGADDPASEYERIFGQDAPTPPLISRQRPS